MIRLSRGSKNNSSAMRDHIGYALPSFEIRLALFAFTYLLAQGTRRAHIKSGLANDAGSPQTPAPGPYRSEQQAQPVPLYLRAAPPIAAFLRKSARNRRDDA